jgi:hypothetical protein
MYALAVGLALTDDAGGDLHAGDAGLGSLLVGGQLGDHVIGDVDTGHVGVHVSAHAGVLGDNDTQLNGLAELLGLLHEGDELLRLIDGLGLEVVGAGHDLALHLGKLRVNGIAAGGDHGALGKLGGLAYQVVAGQILALLQLTHGVQQGDGVQVEHGLCCGVIAQGGVVAGEAEDVVDAEHGGGEQIGLEGQTVPVAAGHLEDGVQTHVLEGFANAQRAHTHDGGLVVRYVDGCDVAEILLGLLQQVIDVDPLGRAYFCGNYKFTTFK